jgi:hypothetical protein
MANDQLMSKIIPSEPFEAVRCKKEETSSDDDTLSNNDKDKDKKNKRLKQDYLLHRYLLQSPISSSTTWCWLPSSLGFSYSTRKEKFFVDRHERQEDVLVCRNEFCKEYLTKLEPRCHRWLGVSR